MEAGSGASCPIQVHIPIYIYILCDYIDVSVYSCIVCVYIYAIYIYVSMDKYVCTYTCMHVCGMHT